MPIAEKLAYVSNEELSNMYVELLAKASSINLASQAHPSFVNAINNFSPDEAILLNAMKFAGDIPFVDVRLTVMGKNEWFSLNPLFFNIQITGKSLAFPENTSAYISNFEGLGILQVRTDVFMVGDNLYEPLEELAKSIYQLTADQVIDRLLTFNKGKIEITPFGRMLIAACTPV